MISKKIPRNRTISSGDIALHCGKIIKIFRLFSKLVYFTSKTEFMPQKIDNINQRGVPFILKLNMHLAIMQKKA